MIAIPPVTALLFMKMISERVPNKNILPFCGKPLFHWILESLSECPEISEIILNTDSEEIADDARKHFDLTIHMRPEALLAIDRDEAYQLMAHDLSICEGDYFLQTHSTTPLVKPETFTSALNRFFGQSAHDSLMSITPVQKRFYYSDGSPVNHDPDRLIKTQELPPLYEENSCIYIFSRQIFEERKNRIGHKPLLYPMDPAESVDIDEIIDFQLAEALMKERLATD